MLSGFSVNRGIHGGDAPIGIILSPDTSDVINSDSVNPCYAGIAFNATGFEFEPTAAGSYSVSRGLWLNAGSASDVWIERVITTGSLTTDAGAGRLNMGTARLFEVQDTTTTGGPVVCDLTFNFYDAASGGTLLATTGLLTFSAERIA